MTLPRTKVSKNQAIINDDGTPTLVFKRFLDDTANPIIIGSGNPDGVVDALQGTLFIDVAGGAGSVLYIKQLSDVGGDTTLGWTL